MSKEDRNFEPYMNGNQMNNNNDHRPNDTEYNELQDLDLHLDLEDLEDMTESETDSEEEGDYQQDWASGEEEAELVQLAHDLQTTSLKPKQSKAEAYQPVNNGALVPLDDGIDVDSEEEKEIMKEIKSEISKQIREEMKSELDVYKKGMEVLERGQIPGENISNETKRNEDLENLEPKLREAFIKMRKLDRILAKKIKREKEVKRDRILLERRIKEEIETLKPEGKTENREEKSNTEKYLALTLPPRHNEGVNLSETPGPDVFATEINEQDYPGLSSDSKQGGSTGGTQRSGNRSSRQNGANSQQDTNSEAGSETSSATKNRKKRKKNFIKRNKELAKDAGSEIAMTDEEKLRVEGLLKDLDELPEILEDEDVEASSFQVALQPGEGFYPDQGELQVLNRIDSRLKQILPPEEFEEVTARPQPMHSKLFTPVGFKSLSNFEHFGERALLENKEQREMKARLQNIEAELAKLHNPDELEIETPRLQEDQLNDLLDQCARSLSRSTYLGSNSRLSQNNLESRDTYRSTETESRASQQDGDTDSMYLPSQDNTPRSLKSDREILMENPPKLSDDDLQKLLSEAHFPLHSRLSTLREEEESESDVDSRPNSITAETWKLISQENTDLNNDDDSEHVNVRQSYSSVNSSVSDRDLNSRNSSSRIPLLPEINRSGSLVSQWNNERPSSRQSNTGSVLTIRNSFSRNDGDMEVMSFDGESVASTPRPPGGDRPNNLSQRSNRNIIQSS